MQCTLATGCPALVAKAGNGKDVVTAMYQWIARIAGAYFYPHWNAISDRTNLSDTYGIHDLEEAMLEAMRSQ